MTDYEPDRRRLERLAAILCERVACQAINDDLLREIAELRPEQTAQLHEQLLVHLDLEEHLAENPPFVSEVMARVREHRGQEEPSEARAPAPQRALAEMFQSERRSKRVLIGVLSLGIAAALAIIAIPFFGAGGAAGGDRLVEGEHLGDPTGPVEIIQYPVLASLGIDAAVSAVSPDLAASETWLSTGLSLRGSEITLREGWIELAMTGEGMLRLVAPCKMRLLGGDRVFLHQGAVSGRTESESAQLVVLTETAEITDTGTAFAVSVADHGKLGIHVYEGEVEVVLAADDSEIISQEMVLAAGDTFGAGDVSAADFPALPELRPVGLEVSAEYRDAVLSSKPLLYWSFDAAVDGERIANEVTSRPEWFGRRLSGKPSFLDAPGGGGRSLFGAGTSQESPASLICDTPITFHPDQGGLTIECWIYTLGETHGVVAALCQPRLEGESAPRHVAMLSLSGFQGRSALFGQPRFLTRLGQPKQSLSQDELEKLYAKNHIIIDRGVTPGAWTHLVAVRTQDSLILYVDGVPQDCPVDEAWEFPQTATLVVGRLDAWRNDRPFGGLIDEFAIYDRPLSALEVTEHFSAQAR